MIGTQDLLIALVLGLFLFGAKRLPELAGAVGKSMKEFRKSMTGETEPPPAAPGGPAACASCQAPLATDWTHCPRCGTPVHAEPPPPASEPPPPATGPR
jgi:sec-independent protein translocase protein TatA